ncbi:MAG: DUF1624 domain-containing protein [Methanosarcinaceae archaeon]|nr:DUF1624 domain-containing protein [Methanosarcinaceae archaeon]
MDKHLETRFWEIDLMRGLAIVLMVVFHLLYDLNYFSGYGFDLNSGLWMYVGRSAAILFILLSGISLSLSFSRTIILHNTGQKVYLKYLKRSLRIFSWGMVITFITWLFLGEGVIVFGILHFIGVSIILAYPFLRFPSINNLLIGVVTILLGLYLGNLTFDSPCLLWLGLRPYGFYTLDYFPVFPWLGVTLIGVSTGNFLYPDFTRKFNIWEVSSYLPIRLGCMLGKKSLFIYLIHQPVLIVLLYLLGYSDIGFLWQ